MFSKLKEKPKTMKGSKSLALLYCMIHCLVKQNLACLLIKESLLEWYEYI